MERYVELESIKLQEQVPTQNHNDVSDSLYFAGSVHGGLVQKPGHDTLHRGSVVHTRRGLQRQDRPRA